MEDTNSKTETLDVITDKYHISAPLFIMFAEYLGYVGETLDWCDDWCTNGVAPEEYKVKFIETEAAAVLKEAISKYGIVKLRNLYDDLYEVVLNVYEENLGLSKTDDKNGKDSLPY